MFEMMFPERPSVLMGLEIGKSKKCESLCNCCLRNTCGFETALKKETNEMRHMTNSQTLFICLSVPYIFQVRKMSLQSVRKIKTELNGLKIAFERNSNGVVMH